MYKKIYSIVFLLAGVLIFMGAGCVKKTASLTPSGKKISPTSSEGLAQPDGKVTVGECAELFAFAPKIDLRYNDLSASYPWTLKFYDKMAALEKKYGITQDELSKICKAKSVEPGFDEEVKK